MALNVLKMTPAAKSAAMADQLAVGPGAEEIRRDVITLFRDASNNSARSQQKAIGPSETGHVCVRNIAHKLAGTPESSTNMADPLPSILGTAAHAWAAEVLEAHNAKIGRRRYLTENTVTVAPDYLHFPPLRGSGDVLDLDTMSVLDWKFLGTTEWRRFVNGYVKDQYLRQIHQYGWGFEQMGFPIRRVALVIVPRSKSLRDTFVHSWDYDRTVAEWTVTRLRKVQTVVAGGVRPIELTPTPGGECHFCPFQGDPARGLCDQGGKTR